MQHGPDIGRTSHELGDRIRTVYRNQLIGLFEIVPADTEFGSAQEETVALDPVFELEIRPRMEFLSLICQDQFPYLSKGWFVHDISPSELVGPMCPASINNRGISECNKWGISYKRNWGILDRHFRISYRRIFLGLFNYLGNYLVHEVPSKG
jgi:hypothetical protein